MGRIPSPPPIIYYDSLSLSLSLKPLISSKDQEDNLVAGKKNPLPPSTPAFSRSCNFWHPFCDGIKYA